MAEISEAKIRQAIWMIKAKKTKKSICEHLGIAYNTKRLDQLIKDCHDKQDREAELKKKARSKIFSKAEKQAIADDYLNGSTQSAIAKQYYISPQRVKNILMEMNVPIRARGKNKAANVEHVVQDLEVKFKEGDKVFLAEQNSFAQVREVYDEDWLERHENGFQKYIEIYPFKPGRNGKAGHYSEPAQGVHYEIYWMLEGEVLPTRKLDAFLHQREKVSKVIEETGRESYLIYKTDDKGGYRVVTRDKLYPVKAG
jgi:sulfite reductase alpha subunit-like flavoprotein